MSSQNIQKSKRIKKEKGKERKKKEKNFKIPFELAYISQKWLL